MSSKDELLQDTEELCEEMESFIRAVMQREFDQSASCSPSLWEGIEKDYEPWFKRLREYRRDMNKCLS